MAMTPDGMATSIAEHMIATMDPQPSDADKAKIRAGCIGLARGIVFYLRDNADVRITTANAGLQRDAGTSTATLAPVADVVLAGALE